VALTSTDATFAKEDVNQDGVITPIDVLRVINAFWANTDFDSLASEGDEDQEELVTSLATDSLSPQVLSPMNDEKSPQNCLL